MMVVMGIVIVGDYGFFLLLNVEKGEIKKLMGRCVQ
jgi:hypothetical protein